MPTEFCFLFIFGARKRIFLFFGVLFFGRKRHPPHFRFFSFSGSLLNWPLKNEKESQYFG